MAYRVETDGVHPRVQGTDFAGLGRTDARGSQSYRMWNLLFIHSVFYRVRQVLD